MKKDDVETEVEVAYEWAMRGIEFERQRILKILESKKNDSGIVSAAWFTLEREINNEQSNS